MDDAGTAVGTCSVAEAHAGPGRRHRAFSVLLYDRDGRVLLQRRAAAKTRFPLRWSNTCCGHQAPGQDTADAAGRRLADELGITAGQTTAPVEVGAFHYYAADAVTGHVEDEWDHVLVAMLVAGAWPSPDENEVGGLRWADPDTLRAEIAADPGCYTPWLPGVLGVAGRRPPAVSRAADAAGIQGRTRT